MINLIKADLYKETKKKSFKFIVMLVVFVSIFSLIIINKNINLETEENIIYPLYSEEEYHSVNKYGSYEQYLKDYDKYIEVTNTENEIINKNNITKLEILLNNSHNFIFILGLIILAFSFHSFSYDYQKDTIKYVFMSKQGRTKIYFSKLISITLLTLFLLALLLITMCITSKLLTGEKIFTITTYISKNGILKETPYILQFIKNISITYLPLFFIIVFSMFLSILLKGSNLGLIISGITYFASFVFSQLLFNYGYMFVKYTFLPYLDFTYLVDKSYVQFNNLIYNLNMSVKTSSIILLIYSLIFIILSLKIIKRDV